MVTEIETAKNKFKEFIESKGLIYILHDKKSMHSITASMDTDYIFEVFYCRHPNEQYPMIHSVFFAISTQKAPGDTYFEFYPSMLIKINSMNAFIVSYDENSWAFTVKNLRILESYVEKAFSALPRKYNYGPRFGKKTTVKIKLKNVNVQQEDATILQYFNKLHGEVVGKESKPDLFLAYSQRELGDFFEDANHYPGDFGLRQTINTKKMRAAKEDLRDSHILI